MPGVIVELAVAVFSLGVDVEPIAGRFRVRGLDGINGATGSGNL
jgi:hypothetical protein